MKKRLRRIPVNGSPGVCSGLSEYFNINVTIVRLIFIFGALFTVFSFGLVYLLLWFVIPE